MMDQQENQVVGTLPVEETVVETMEPSEAVAQEMSAPPEKKRSLWWLWVIIGVGVLAVLTVAVLIVVAMLAGSKPQVTDALFTDGMVTVQLGDKIGWIDEDGKYVINPQFEDVGADFSEGLAPVQSGEKWGYVDTEGSLVIQPIFDSASSFNEGLAMVKSGEMYGFIDKEGKYVISPQYDSCRNFYGNLAVVEKDEKYGLIDKKGNVVVNPQFDSVGSWYEISEGSAEEVLLVEIGDKYGFVDKSGKYVINPMYDDYWGGEEGIMSVEKDDKWGAIRLSDGSTVVEFQFDDMYGFNDGMVVVEMDEKYGYADTTGTLIVQPIYDSAVSFYDGYARVGKENKDGDTQYGFIDKTGKEVIALQYSGAGTAFHNELCPAQVGEDDKWGYIDITGNFVIAPQFDSADGFEDGYAGVESGDKEGIIDTDGAYVVAPQYGVISGIYADDGYAIAINTGKKYVIIDLASGTQVGSEYDGINFIGFYFTDFCAEENCYSAAASDSEYCYTHKPSTDTSSRYCLKYGCYNYAYGDSYYCLYHLLYD